MGKCSCYKGGEGKSGLDENRPTILVATALKDAQRSKVSTCSTKNIGPLFWVHVHLHVREVSGATPLSPSKVGRPGLPLPLRFQRPCSCKVSCTAHGSSLSGGHLSSAALRKASSVSPLGFLEPLISDWTPPTLAVLHTAWKCLLLLHLLPWLDNGLYGVHHTWGIPLRAQAVDGLWLYCSACPGPWTTSCACPFLFEQSRQGGRVSPHSWLAVVAATASRLQTDGLGRRHSPT